MFHKQREGFGSPQLGGKVKSHLALGALTVGPLVTLSPHLRDDLQVSCLCGLCSNLEDPRIRLQGGGVMDSLKTNLEEPGALHSSICRCRSSRQYGCTSAPSRSSQFSRTSSIRVIWEKMRTREPCSCGWGSS